MLTRLHRESRRKKTFFLAIFSLVFVFFTAPNAYAQAGQAYVSTTSSKISQQSEFSVDVFIDSTKLINALDLQISYPAGKLSFLNSSDVHSIVAFWQGGISLVSKGHIILRGALTTPFIGRGGFVATLTFRALLPGEAKINFERSDLYLSDGLGTKLSIPTSFLPIEINANVSKTETPIAQNQDITLPTLDLRLVQDPVSGNDLLVYKAEDSDSGIRTVEMRSRKLLTWSSWQKIENPTPYPDGADKVEVRAINTAGGITVQSLAKARSSFPWSSILIAGIAVLACVLLYNKRRHQPKL